MNTTAKNLTTFVEMFSTASAPMATIPSLILPFCIMATSFTTGAAMIQTEAVSRDIYVPPDINEMTSDARKWYLTGVSNANQGLDDFGSIATSISQGEDASSELKTQLRSVLTQVTDASQNSKELVPKLRSLISNLVSWTRDPGWFDKLKLKITISYINGKRDNKSYYLQNGAALWFKLRLDEHLKTISAPNDKIRKLIGDFERLKDVILLARDTLDDSAQHYVQGIARLVDLVPDVGANENEIREVVDKMQSEIRQSSQSIIDTAERAAAEIQAEIDSLNRNF